MIFLLFSQLFIIENFVSKTMKPLVRRRSLWHLIWVITVGLRDAGLISVNNLYFQFRNQVVP